MLRVVPGRLGEAMVEEAEPTARDVRDDAIEDRAICFIGVEAKIEEVAKETAALRDAERMGALSSWLAFHEQRILLRFVVAQERDQVAGRGVAETLHDRALGLADQFIDVARPKAAPEPQPNVPKCARHAVLDLRDGLALQLPLAARNRDPFIGFPHSPGQDAFLLAALGWRIAAVAVAARKGHRLG